MDSNMEHINMGQDMGRMFGARTGAGLRLSGLGHMSTALLNVGRGPSMGAVGWPKYR